MERKHSYFKVIQQYCASAYGWEDVSFYETNSNYGRFVNPQDKMTIKKDYREYELLGYPTRIINRCEKNNENN
jgi:hypothetical protein